MARYVFISYSSVDKPTADAVCASPRGVRFALLDRSARCAPRDPVRTADRGCHPRLVGVRARLLLPFQRLGAGGARGRPCRVARPAGAASAHRGCRPQRVARVLPRRPALARCVRAAAGGTPGAAVRGGAEPAGEAGGHDVCSCRGSVHAARRAAGAPRRHGARLRAVAPCGSVGAGRPRGRGRRPARLRGHGAPCRRGPWGGRAEVRGGRGDGGVRRPHRARGRRRAGRARRPGPRRAGRRAHRVRGRPVRGARRRAHRRSARAPRRGSRRRRGPPHRRRADGGVTPAVAGAGHGRRRERVDARAHRTRRDVRATRAGHGRRPRCRPRLARPGPAPAHGWAATARVPDDDDRSRDRALLPHGALREGGRLVVAPGRPDRRRARHRQVPPGGRALPRRGFPSRRGHLAPGPLSPVRRGRDLLGPGRGLQGARPHPGDGRPRDRGGQAGRHRARGPRRRVAAQPPSRAARPRGAAGKPPRRTPPPGCDFSRSWPQPARRSS